jgi:hypothetical protein
VFLPDSIMSVAVGARTPGGIHLRLLGCYKHVAMWPTSENSVNAKFAERRFSDVGSIGE